MSELLTAQTQTAAKPNFTPMPSNLLQRQCACGQHTSAGGECEECKQKREGTLQRAAISPSPLHEVPPIVHEVLRSPGQPLDAETRAFMGPRFGHDFSRIPTYTPASGVMQTKLAVNKPGDEYEQEADRIADQVLAAPAGSAVSSAPSRIQRYAGQATEGTETAPASVDRVLGSPGRPLDPALRQDMGQRFGYDFSRVRVHSGAAAEQSARDVNANAYTVGHNIVFGAGQFIPGTQEGRRLVAHELTHVVQQTGVDRVRVNQSNENRGLSPITFPSIQREIIQRKKAPPTDFGEFETTKFVEADGRGVEIALKFTPDESKVDAKKIALSQSIRTALPSGAAYAIDPNQAGRMVAGGKSGAGYYIDTLPGANNPLYGERNTLGPAQDLKDTPASANTTTAPVNLGVNTNYELGYCYKEKPTDASKKKHPAGLWDKPQGGGKKGESKMFETTAFAIEGTDKDKYYGSVTWGYKMEGTDAAPTVTKIDIDRASKGTPTANFIEPAELWNVGKTPGTIKVTADPEATVLKGDASGTEKLAKDTKVKQLDTVMWGADPAIKAEVLKADGSGSGKIVYIKNSDVKDMGDGSANKKLPIPVAKPAIKKTP